MKSTPGFSSLFGSNLPRISRRLSARTTPAALVAAAILLVFACSARAQSANISYNLGALPRFASTPVALLDASSFAPSNEPSRTIAAPDFSLANAPAPQSPTSSASLPLPEPQLSTLSANAMIGSAGFLPRADGGELRAAGSASSGSQPHHVRKVFLVVGCVGAALFVVGAVDTAAHPSPVPPGGIFGLSAGAALAGVGFFFAFHH